MHYNCLAIVPKVQTLGVSGDTAMLFCRLRREHAVGRENRLLLRWCIFLDLQCITKLPRHKPACLNVLGTEYWAFRKYRNTMEETPSKSEDLMKSNFMHKGIWGFHTDTLNKKNF